MKQLSLMTLIAALVWSATLTAAQDQSQPVDADFWHGLYVTPNERLTVTEQGVQISSLGSCERLLAILNAGEWSVTDRFSYSLDPEMFYSNTWAILRRGAEGAMVLTNGSSDYCTARLSAAAQQPVRVSGAESVEHTALTFSLGCSATTEFYDYNADEDLPGVALSLIYDLGDGHSLMLSDMTVPLEVGAFEIWEPDDTTLHFITSEHLLAGEFFPNENGEYDEDFSFIPGETAAYYADYGEPSGVVTVTSLQPLSGSIQIDVMYSDNGDEIQFSGGFTCYHVTGADSLN